MTCQFVCDNCGKVAVGPRGRLQPSPPLSWTICVARSGFLHACSLQCLADLREERAPVTVKKSSSGNRDASPR